jgi:MFS transporter, ACS family, hexuronate transporter
MNSAATKIGHYRYRILALVFMATSINYFDRTILGVLAPKLMEIFSWSEKNYSSIIISFQIAYALGLLAMGGIIDKIGTKKGYTISIAIWSLFGMLHAAIRPAFSLIGFIMARFGLGLGESGNFPSAIKTVAEWFPKKDRAFATGIFDSSTSIGAILAPVVVGLIVAKNGDNWQYPFLITGLLSSLWVFLWWKTYRKPEEHPKVSKAELDYINSDSEPESTESIPWAKVLPKRETWAFAITTITDAVWWFYIFWGAKFLAKNFAVDIDSMGLPFLIIFVLADAGSLIGGYMSGFLIKRGWSINKARKITLLVSACIVFPVSFVPVLASKWLAVFLIGLGAAGHQSWSINSYTLVPDVFPKKATASVIGIGKMIGVFTSIAASLVLGIALDKAGNSGYFWAFVLAGSSYLVIIGFVHLLMPKMTPLDDNLKYIVK